MSDLLSPEAFAELFDTFEHTAFRLEVRSRYEVDEEQEPYYRFIKGREPQDQWFEDWVEFLQQLTAEGRRIERVRILDEPPSGYQLWMRDLDRRLSRPAGENIRYLARSKAAELGLPDEDYWLFDSKMAVVLRFEGDRLLGAEPVSDPSQVVRKGYFRDAAWHYARPVTED